MSYALNYARLMSTSEVFKRGEILFRNNAVSRTGYEPASGNTIFKVQGSQLYKVSIHKVDKKIFNTHCSCPYNYHGICKHVVAALLYIENENGNVVDVLQSQRAKAKASYKLRKQNSVFELKEYEHITRDFIAEHYRQFNQLYIYNSEVIFFDFEKDKVVLNFRINYTVFETVFFKKENKVFIQSNDKSRVYENNLKEGEAYALMLIADSKTPNMLHILFDKLDTIKRNTLSDYGINEDDDFFKYFTFEFFPKEGLLQKFKEPSIGMIPVTQESENFFSKILNTISDDDESVLISIEKKEKRTLGFVISLHSKDYYDEKFLDFKAFVGKTDKKGNNITTKLSYFYEINHENFDIKISDSQKKIIDLIEKLDFIEDEQEQFNLQNAIFHLLKKEKFVYLKINSQRLQKNKLTKMQIADKPAQALIKVEKDNDFITAHLFFKTDDQELIRANKTPWDILGVIIKNNTLHFIDNYHSVILAKSKIGVFKMPVTHKEIFYKKVIEPLSKHFILEFEEDTFNNESYELDFSSKQIFLSEKDQYLIIRPQVKYDNGKEVILTNIGNLIEKQEDKIIEYKRNYELEEFFLNEIAELHPSFEEQKSNKIFYIHYEDFMEKMWFFKFFEQMQQKHIEVYGLKNLKNFKYSPYKGKISTSINSGIDWFDVNITMSFGNNEVSLQDIKKAVINKERYILLKDGSVGILPEEWFHKLEKYFRNGEINKNKLKISKLRFSIIDELFDNIDNDKIVKELAQKRKLLEQFKKIDKVTVPKNIKAELRNYQKEGLNWLYFLKKMKWGGILADDMGLGKTLQILSFIQKDLAKQKKAHLIVVPTTLLFNWQKEIEKFAPDIKALYHYGPDRAKDTKDFNKFHIIFTTYGILLRDIELLKTYRFKYMILDESQAIKNPASRRYKAASLIQAENKLALTGTPIENSTFDLYAQMNFVNPGFLGSLNSFKKNYSNPIDKEGNETIASELQKIINPFVLRRTKEQVAKELPPKIEDIIYCEMSEEQRKVYEAYKNNYRNKILKKIEKDGLNKSKLFVLEALTRLRQICDSPLLLKDDEIQITESIKIKEIVNHITEKTANHKVLIFSQFVEMLSLLRKELEKLNIDYEYLDGKSSTTQREASVNNFQTNNYLRVFLISLKAGGTGLNLTAADYVYILDPWWNPAVENQAIDRCYRIGQDKHVFAYRMICKNTIEEKILDLQSKKKKIATDIIQTDENIIKTIDIKDIKELLG